MQQTLQQAMQRNVALQERDNALHTALRAFLMCVIILCFMFPVFSLDLCFHLDLFCKKLHLVLILSLKTFKP
jgi:hypothetical protein